MRKLVTALCAAAAAFITSAPFTAGAQSAPDSIVIVGEGTKGAQIAIPRGTTVAVRVEGRDKAGKPVALDPAKIAWRAAKNRSFSAKVENGVIRVTAERDAFDADGKEPGAMLFATYEGKTAGVMVYAVLNVEGKWHLSVTGDELDLDLKQSGRWVKDDKGRRGTIRGKILTLRIVHVIRVIGIPISLTLHPVVTFTSRTGGTGTVEIPNKTEKFDVTKLD